jgi:hypothetical protein
VFLASGYGLFCVFSFWFGASGYGVEFGHLF